MAGTQMLAVREAESAPAAPPVAPAVERPQAFERLHALVRKGYRADIGVEAATDVVLLRHPGRAPDLVLHADGTVAELDARRPWHKRGLDPFEPIAAGQMPEQLRFMRFLETVPRITLRDRTRRFRRNFVYWPVALFVIWLACMSLTVMIMEL